MSFLLRLVPRERHFILERRLFAKQKSCLEEQGKSCAYRSQERQVAVTFCIQRKTIANIQTHEGCGEKEHSSLQSVDHDNPQRIRNCTDGESERFKKGKGSKSKGKGDGKNGKEPRGKGKSKKLESASTWQARTLVQVISHGEKGSMQARNLWQHRSDRELVVCLCVVYVQNFQLRSSPFWQPDYFQNAAHNRSCNRVMVWQYMGARSGRFCYRLKLEDHCQGQQRNTIHLGCGCESGSRMLCEDGCSQQRGHHSGKFCNERSEKVAVVVDVTQELHREPIASIDIDEFISRACSIQRRSSAFAVETVQCF